MKIALAQMENEGTIAKNLEKSISIIEKAAENDADLVLFPEVQLTEFFPQYEKKDVSQYRLGIDSDEVKAFRTTCKKNQIMAAPNIYLEEGYRAYDASVLIDKNGEVVGIQKMVHVAQAKYFYEQDYYTPSTVEAVMKWFAKEEGYEAESTYWGIVGLLHDIDFELYPDEHCLKAPELLRDGNVSEDIIHAVCSHGYGITVGNGTTIEVEPIHHMEKVLFAVDELTGLIWSASLMRPSKSTKDMELKSLKKKYKSKGFAAGCSREVIERGALQLGWELDILLERTLKAMSETEDDINVQISML